MNNSPHPSRVLTIQEVSAYLRIPLSTLYSLAQKGKIPATKFGKHWRFLEADVVNFFHRKVPKNAA